MRAPVGLLVLPCGLFVSAVIGIRVSPPRHGRLCSYNRVVAAGLLIFQNFLYHCTMVPASQLRQKQN